MSGARLATILTVGRSSAHLILERMHREHMLQILERKPGGILPPGRPTTDYALNPACGSHLGVALETDRIQWALCSFDGASLDRGTVMARPGEGARMTLSRFFEGFGGESKVVPQQPPIVSVGIAISELKHLEEPSELDAKSVARHFPGAEVQVVGAAFAGAVADSLESFSKPRSVLYVEVLQSFDVAASVASGGDYLFGELRASGPMRGLKSTLCDLASEHDGLIAPNTTWTRLIAAAESDPRALASVDRLLGELARQLYELALFSRAERVVLESPERELAAFLQKRIRPLVERLVEREGRRVPLPVAAVHEAHATARGAALLGIGRQIAQSLRFFPALAKE
ncbi:MAG: hypothetical protein SF028_00070 [Candidatus Sumerlaeia bacterium]|nr:hypothetical protein [Candidatus Sumerlaeia bacterium]